jgi:hypothetical protein
MCSTTRRSAANLLSERGICELGAGGTGHLDRVEALTTPLSPVQPGLSSLSGVDGFESALSPSIGSSVLVAKPRGLA